jgi:hypothetical protein
MRTWNLADERPIVIGFVLYRRLDEKTGIRDGSSYRVFNLQMFRDPCPGVQ